MANLKDAPLLMERIPWQHSSSRRTVSREIGRRSDAAHNLYRALTIRGLEVLSVTVDPANPSMLTVYLHGNAGQSGDDHALTLIADVPGIVTVTESAITPTILLAEVYPPADRAAPLKEIEQ